MPTPDRSIRGGTLKKTGEQEKPYPHILGEVDRLSLSYWGLVAGRRA